MIYSMTGYGKAEGEYGGRHYRVDIRTLNGKSTDVRMKVPNHFKSKEIQLRAQVLEQAYRGKIDVSIQTVTTEAGPVDHGLNMTLVEKYYDQLKSFADAKGMPPQDFLQTIIRIPNVITSQDEEITDEEWAFVKTVMSKALSELGTFRKAEGKSLSDDLTARVKSIMDLQSQVTPYEEERKTILQERLLKQISEYQNNEKVDKNRLEQEVIYYLEKLDIHEEKVRLHQHCEYFLQELNSDQDQMGKKLNFISQEMGREINTLGSKAQQSDIQRIVVKMKVELDQIKEQLANVL